MYKYTVSSVLCIQIFEQGEIGGPRPARLTLGRVILQAATKSEKGKKAVEKQGKKIYCNSVAYIGKVDYPKHNKSMLDK